MENNLVKITGTVTTEPEYSHEIGGEKFYNFMVTARRTSEFPDTLPMVVSDRVFDIRKLHVEDTVSITGQFRSRNTREGNKNRVILYIFVIEASIIDASITGDACNEIELHGSICKMPVYRKTPLGREIADTIVAVKRANGYSDYIPCIVWGRNARYMSGLEPGTKIAIIGRLQSREYAKENKTRTAYEVSVKNFELEEE